MINTWYGKLLRLPISIIGAMFFSILAIMYITLIMLFGEWGEK